MKIDYRTLILLPLASLVICAVLALAADDAPEIPCPESCDNSRKNCEFSCSRIVGGGVESGKKRECLATCADEEVECDKRCLNPTPRPTLEPEPYSDKTCAGACEYRSRDCIESCTKHVGGGAASVERAACEKDCGEELGKCNNLCANPAPAPAFNPEVYENNPCSATCASKLGECEGNCSMFSGEGGKHGECMEGCKNAEYECLTSCPR
jgi:hypothetical protein